MVRTILLGLLRGAHPVPVRADAAGLRGQGSTPERCLQIWGCASARQRGSSQPLGALSWDRRCFLRPASLPFSRLPSGGTTSRRRPAQNSVPAQQQSAGQAPRHLRRGLTPHPGRCTRPRAEPDAIRRGLPGTPRTHGGRVPDARPSRGCLAPTPGSRVLCGASAFKAICQTKSGFSKPDKANLVPWTHYILRPSTYFRTP